ncbi:hypothetical protein FISHEDRAFT_51256 [Fistulina hepatica ATCC 64428]|uniref:Cytoplasmic protein n=1 Tax=Fistulina hepatica ATCC 64428 TaxID=1128425 RepID=A0A0D7A3U1_9AGAR|nr:hypothetical protein FISHEDRAFT_51256 [Fistulina hepatica ATCC 64428]
MSWEPLPLIVYGYAIHPLSPSRRDTRATMASRNRLSVVTEASTDTEHMAFSHRDVVSLEVGDEVYAFEQYTPRSKETDGVWYRGYVVSTIRRPTDAAAFSKAAKSEETQQVFIGIFPASHIHIRDYLSDAEGRLGDYTDDGRISTVDRGSMRDRSGSITGSTNGGAGGRSIRRYRHSTTPSVNSMSSPASSFTASLSNGNIIGFPEHNRTRMSRTDTATVADVDDSIDPVSNKPLPPRPSLRTGDDTQSGVYQPIVDEIASALREWHLLMFHHLARRDYELFELVREHVEALHLGRRQLLAQTAAEGAQQQGGGRTRVQAVLSADETIAMRRDCVLRLVTGNIAQDLDVIVRHPTWGGLVTCGMPVTDATGTTDVEMEIDRRSWVSAVRMYAMQVSLAYMNVDGFVAPVNNSTSEYALLNTPGPIPTPANSVFPSPLATSQSFQRSAVLTPRPHTAKFYHIYVELRAFVATPCAPGETVELLFSLFRTHGSQFITEEFCIVLDSHGVPLHTNTNELARGGPRRRTLFTDLTAVDVRDPMFLVCRIVRRGALKMGPAAGSGSQKEHSRPNSVPPSPVLSPGDSSATLDPAHFRRPFGCAVLELTQLTEMTSYQAKTPTSSTNDVSPMQECSMPIFVPTMETSFSTLHQNIIINNSKEFEKSPRADCVAVSVKVFRGDAPTLTQEHSSLLQDIPRTLRLGFPDVVFPDDVRNELYIKLWSGDFGSLHTSTVRSSTGRLAGMPGFSRGNIGSTQARNIQVTVEVRDQTGRAVEGVVSQGCGVSPVSSYRSMVFQRCNEPTFGELIKIHLPPDGIPQWHLFFSFRDRQPRESRSSRSTATSASNTELESPFAFAFQPLFPDRRAFAEDGSHVLIMYRANQLSQMTPDMYLTAPAWLAPGQRPEQVSILSDMQRLAPPTRDTLTIRTSLCSTRYTQNAVLLSLLNWEKVIDKELLATVLNKFTFVSEAEIVKFLRDIFDALFGILVSNHNASSEMDPLVFTALVTVLGIVQDRRFVNFQPVLELYIEKHFNFPHASAHILQSMNRLLLDSSGVESGSVLRSALKVWHYLFKFIARAREIQQSKENAGPTAEHQDTMFKREVRTHMNEVSRMMSAMSPAAMIGTQTIALQHFPSILPELAKIFTTVELVSIVTTFANAVSAHKGRIIIWKLIMYLHVVKGFLFDNSQSRPLLVEAVVIWIKQHFGRYDEFTNTQPGDSESAKDAARVNWLESIRLCVTIIAVMLDRLQTNLVDPVILKDRQLLRRERDNVDNIIPLIPRLLDSYMELKSPESMKAMEHARSISALKFSVPVSFPESYPFSLLSYLPTPPKKLKSSSLLARENSVFIPAFGETAMVFLVLALISPPEFISNFLQSSLDIEGRDRFVALLSQIFKVANSMLDNEAWPKTWLNVNILAHKVWIGLMWPIAAIMVKEFIPSSNDESFNASLWTECFYTLLKLLSSDQLVIEEFSPQKRRAVWRLAGDVRGDGATILLNLWEALGWGEQPSITGEIPARFGAFQLHLSPLVGHVVNLCLSHHDQLRNNAAQILFTMIVSDYQTTGSFEAIENEIVTRLDHLFMSDSKGDDISRAFFIGQLRHLFDSSEVDDQLRERVSNFLDSVDLFLDLLLNVRGLPEGEEFADDRVIATLRLMNFIRRIGRDEIYIKYVHQLVNMHLQSNNYVEAALTLKLHADLHEWDLNSFVGPMEDLGLPQQSQFHRKETLCLLILDYLGKGKAWERAIAICKELALQHAEVTFNYTRLAEILRHEAMLLEHIVNDQRYYPDYYRVSFFGAFPAAIRDKNFIYRGFEWEKYGAFCERMLNKHPGAQLIKYAAEPPVDIRFGTEHFIQCVAVTPEPDRSLALFNSPDVPAPIKAYHEHSDVNLFSLSRPVKRIMPDGTEEVWIEKTYYTTEETFPTVLRRSEIITIESVEISPLESAIEEVENKTKELASLEIKYQSLAKTSQVVSTNPLSMSLNGAVDAPINTGVAYYRQTFLNDDYLNRHSEAPELVEKLCHAIDEQVRVIDRCLKLHALLCPPEFLPFQETLEIFFRKNFKEDIRRLDIQVSDSSAMSPSSHSFRHSTYEQSLKLSTSTASTKKPFHTFHISPLHIGRSASSSLSPLSPVSVSSVLPDTALTPRTTVQQTPLQRHLQHLARHGINGVASAPEAASDALSVGDSVRNSFAIPTSTTTLMNGVHSVPMQEASSGASMIASTLSMGSLTSLKERFSRLGSLNFVRKGNHHHHHSHNHKQ